MSLVRIIRELQFSAMINGAKQLTNFNQGKMQMFDERRSKHAADLEVTCKYAKYASTMSSNVQFLSLITLCYCRRYKPLCDGNIEKDGTVQCTTKKLHFMMGFFHHIFSIKKHVLPLDSFI